MESNNQTKLIDSECWNFLHILFQKLCYDSSSSNFNEEEQNLMKLLVSYPLNFSIDFYSELEKDNLFLNRNNLIV